MDDDDLTCRPAGTFVVVPATESHLKHFRGKRERGDRVQMIGTNRNFRSSKQLFILGIAVGLSGSIPVVAGAIQVCSRGTAGAGRRYDCAITAIETDPAILPGKKGDMEDLLVQAAVRAARALGYHRVLVEIDGDDQGTRLYPYIGREMKRVHRELSLDLGTIELPPSSLALPES